MCTFEILFITSFVVSIIIIKSYKKHKIRHLLDERKWNEVGVKYFVFVSPRGRRDDDGYSFRKLSVRSVESVAAVVVTRVYTGVSRVAQRRTDFPTPPPPPPAYVYVSDGRIAGKQNVGYAHRVNAVNLLFVIRLKYRTKISRQR